MSPDGARARLFTAVVPSAEAVTALRRELDRHPRVAGDGRLRWTTVRQWHVTLGFYGDDDPDGRAAWVRARLAGLRAPVMRMRGAGSFPGVLWTGISGEPLAELAAAVRPPDERRPFHAHLTLARGRNRAALTRWRRRLAAFVGPEWTATEVVLLRSDPGPAPGSGPRYTSVARFGLDAPSGPACTGPDGDGTDILDS